jgi:hypothetical protein
LQPTDIALGLLTDGFGPFKKCKQSCWPLITFNYNLPPEIQFHLINIICFGIILGPKQPKNLNSFLIPLIDELIKLMCGMPAYDATQSHQLFVLRAYLIMVFGDMPAVAKLMRMKGVNGIFPCCACNIQVSVTALTTNPRPITPLFIDWMEILMKHLNSLFALTKNLFVKPLKLLRHTRIRKKNGVLSNLV